MAGLLPCIAMITKITLAGATGRMGCAIVRAIAEDPSVRLTAALDRPDCPSLGRDAGECAGVDPLGVPITTDATAALRDSDVVIDFTSPAGTAAILEGCEEAARAAVVGTTGLDATAQRAIERAAAVAPVVVAPNMSVGVTLLFHLAARAAQLLGPTFDAEVVEIHHKRKVDAPSGTAAHLAEVVARAKELEPESAVVHGRSGQVGARPPGEVGVMSLRGGDVIGDHTALFVGFGERIELTHRAQDRTIYALGAVRAAKWAAGRGGAGRFDMADVIGVPR